MRFIKNNEKTREKKIKVKINKDQREILKAGSSGQSEIKIKKIDI